MAAARWDSDLGDSNSAGVPMQGKGKIAAQCGHAVAGIFTKFRKRQPVPFQQWSMLGQAKIALKVPTTRDLVRARRPG